MQKITLNPREEITVKSSKKDSWIESLTWRPLSQETIELRQRLGGMPLKIHARWKGHDGMTIIRTRSGKGYAVTGMHHSEFNDWVSSPSWGKFYHEKIKSFYRRK